mgnify:CR=1 FL=1
MKQTMIKLNKDSKPIKVDLYTTKDRNLSIKDIAMGSEALLLQLCHGSLHAILDFTEAADSQLLSFDDKGKFIGASLAINNAYGFMIQSQAHFVLLLPLDKSIKDLLEVESLDINSWVPSSDH